MLNLRIVSSFPKKCYALKHETFLKLMGRKNLFQTEENFQCFIRANANVCVQLISIQFQTNYTIIKQLSLIEITFFIPFTKAIFIHFNCTTPGLWLVIPVWEGAGVGLQNKQQK